MAGEAEGRRRGRPGLGLLSGFLLGLAVAVDLLVFGVVPLNSLLLVALPVLGLVVGLLVGMWAPFGRRSGRGQSAGGTTAAVLGLLLIAAGPVLAAEQEPTLPPSLEGPCDGQATIEGYGTIDPEASAGIYLVPRSGTAEWRGSVDREPGQREVSGSIWLELPVGSASLGEWGPDGEEVEASGTYRWTDRQGEGPEGATVLDGLRWVPSNVRFQVSGRHVDTVGTCTGYVELKLDGGFGDSPVGAAGLGLTALSLAGLGFAGWPRKP